jgi:hypothetical protein
LCIANSILIFYLRNAYMEFHLSIHLACFLVVCDCRPTEWVPTRCQRMALWYWGSKGSGITGKAVAYITNTIFRLYRYSGYDITLPSNPELMQIHDDDPPEIKENDDRTIEVEKVCLIWFRFKLMTFNLCCSELVMIETV